MDSIMSGKPSWLMLLVIVCWALAAQYVESVLPSEEDFQMWVDHVRDTQHHHETLNPKLVKAERKRSTIIVAPDGTGNFQSVAKAIASIPEENDNRWIVHIKAGIYREKIVVPKSRRYVTLQGEGSSRTVITWNATASDKFPNGTLFKTFNSATVAIHSKYFIARDITFQNSAPIPKPGEPSGRQAVALRVSEDMAAFYNCVFYGGQDTLYDHRGRHYFKNCLIEGTVDFIFGYGRSLYKDCELRSISRNSGSITAQKRSDTVMNSGFSFVDCEVEGSGKIFLGRAWGERSRVVFSHTYMDAIVLPEGWNNWSDPQRNSTVFYGEYACSGPGANNGKRVTWAKILTYDEAKLFLDEGFVHGSSWLLST